MVSDKNPTIRKDPVLFDHVYIFFISLFCITLELFLTRILNFKAWNHVVYTVIPFAILGYGIGANLYLIFQDKFLRYRKETVLGWGAILLALLCFVCVLILIYLPIRIDYLVEIFHNLRSVGMLLVAYSVFMVPFIFIGFLVVYLFSQNPKDVSRLYFFDLIGAGAGAILFFPLINNLAVLKSIALLCLISLAMALFLLFSRKKMIALAAGAVLLLAGLSVVKEPDRYNIDPKKGWEWIPGFFTPDTYEHVVSRWHPLGRTDVYRMTDEAVRQQIVGFSAGTFQINVQPRPEFAYFSTNFLAGTPVYNLSAESLAKQNSQVKLFSQSMEAPYLLLKEPRVVVIGVGGGRDIFMAKTHGATQISGAEINPAIVKEMARGGKMFEYSGRVYESPDTHVEEIDGRHLVKTIPANSVDFIVLNGVDTFSGLSSGAYAYAESYLYTKNAVSDYLRILNDNGIVNFNRWLFRDMPRETLRLFAIALAALKETGAPEPWRHIIIGASNGWGMTLIKKTPFEAPEIELIMNYFRETGMEPVYPPPPELIQSKQALILFSHYADFFKRGEEASLAREYPYDISIISDDNPFFYKYYKLSSFNPFATFALHHTGPIIFMTQLLVLLQAIIFILLFIFLPLGLFRKKGGEQIPPQGLGPFILYFSCLGLGFMFFEIPLMQRFVLLLGSPIYSITVILAVLLITTGMGSFCLARFTNFFKSVKDLLGAATVFVLFYALTIIFLGTSIYDRFMYYSFAVRIILVSAIIAPLGLALGFFFPAGLQLLSSRYKDAMVWAWGLNCGFSVLGSILAIIIAQYFGFNTILLLACITYLLAILAFSRLEQIK